ncbi:Uncharacterized protein GBIM_04546, partial [Gryllus bimaculatus]
MCMEFGATVIPEIMIRELSGKIVPIRPTSKEKGRESEERRPRKSRAFSLSPGRASQMALEHLAAAAAAPGGPGPPDAHAHAHRPSTAAFFEIPMLAETLRERGTNLVEICVEDNPSQAHNYYLILRECKKLQALFLRGCKIDNAGTKLLADELTYSEENAQTSLLYLNLSKNMIDDEGASALAK